MSENTHEKLKYYIPIKHFEFDHGEVLLIGKNTDGWCIEASILTNKHFRGYKIGGNGGCFAFVVATMELFTEELALRTLNEPNYVFVDDFTEMDLAYIEKRHDEIHKNLNIPGE